MVEIPVIKLWHEFYHERKCRLTLCYLNCTISFEYMIFMRVKNQKTTVNNDVKTTEQIFVIDPLLN